MKCAADFRAIARDALRGRWGIAVLAGFLAMLLGAVTGEGAPSFNSSSGEALSSFNLPEELILTIAVFILVTVSIALLVSIFVGSVVEVGYAGFNLDLVDRREVSIGQLFSYFPYWKTMVVASLLRSVFVFLWSLLLIIPGIVAGYSYAMTPYILADHPDMTASEAISASKAMMEGNRWRLFCLEVSFIGWSLLSALTLGIGSLWLTPYTSAAKAAFYREISGTEVYEPVDIPPLPEEPPAQNNTVTWDER